MSLSEALRATQWSIRPVAQGIDSLEGLLALAKNAEDKSASVLVIGGAQQSYIDGPRRARGLSAAVERPTFLR